MSEPIKFTLNKYYYDISKPEQYHEYQTQVVSRAENLSFKIFQSVSESHHSKGWLQDLPTKVVVDTDFLFNNQFNTVAENGVSSGYRLHFWYEAMYPNKDIKEGYFVTGDIDEMYDLLSRTYVNGYTGETVTIEGNDTPPYCDDSEKTLSSEHLEKSQLRQLMYSPLRGEKEIMGQQVLAKLEEQYKFYQTKANRLREQQRHKAAMDEHNKKQRQMVKEHEIRLEVVKARGNCKNLIYYSHTDTFCYGWNQHVTENQGEQFLKDVAHIDAKFEVNR